MAKAVLVCKRNRDDVPLSDHELQIISKRLMPDNISAAAPRLEQDRGVALGVINPNPCVLVRNCSICLGDLFEKDDRWFEPESGTPDGTYAIMRSNADCVELLSDIVASRTIWYFKNDDVFVASTSQRAIIALVGSFTFDRSTVPWILSTGTLGPSLSWDSRIRALPGDSSLILNRTSWEMAVETSECKFQPAEKSDGDHLRELKQALQDTFSSMEFDHSRWALPLSGGYDSRALLFMLGAQKDLRCITWGLKASLSEEGNDAYVAKALAERYKIRHEYHETGLTDEPIENIFVRFLSCAEGRIDHISGYLDGFLIWKKLFEAGIHGVIRGDEGFGWSDVSSEEGVRVSVGLTMLSDFGNWDELKEFGLESQTIPLSLKRDESETLEMWRDRLYHEFRIPTILAALTEPKTSYVELINPLLSRRIIQKAREMPDKQRTDKTMFRRIVRSLAPDIGFASRSAIADPGAVLRRPEAVEVIRRELESEYARELLPHRFIDYILGQMQVETESTGKTRPSLADRIKPLLPRVVKNILRPLAAKKGLDSNLLAFRVYMICKMNRMLRADADVLR